MKDQKILMLVAEEYEDLELQYPKYRMMEEGARVLVAGKKSKETYKGKHGYPCQADLSIDEVKVDEFQAVIIPGGYAPDKLRRIPKVLEILKQFDSQQKLIAFICHAGWLPISAGIIKGVKCTSFSSIKDDMVNAGAHWVDEPVVVDRHFISSRFPDDLPQFCPAIIDYLAKKQKVLR
jgi:protease I